MEKNFLFTPEWGRTSEGKVRDVHITIVGSPEQPPEGQREAFGKALAQRLVAALNDAQMRGKKRLVFDMPTGSTPQALWPALHDMITQGIIDPAALIVMGHEEAWGTYEEGSHSDFDAYRRKEFFERNDIPIHEVRDASAISGKVVRGNFIPMHLDSDPHLAMARYGEIIDALRARPDTAFFGIYGVGTDGHVCEMQVGDLGIAETMKRKQPYAIPVQLYSFDMEEPHLFRWKHDDGSFREEDNVFVHRKKDMTAQTRATREDYGGMEKIAGLGWRQMIAQDSLALAFNDKSKQLAFQLALEGSMDGSFIDSQGRERGSVVRERGEGEKILPDMLAFAEVLEKEGILSGEWKAMSIAGDAKRRTGLACDGLFRAIFQAFAAHDIEVGDPRGYYETLWSFVNRYIGKRAPVSRLIRLRSLLGKPTELIATPEVIRGTRYENFTQL